MIYSIPMSVDVRFADAMSVLHPEASFNRDYSVVVDPGPPETASLTYWGLAYDPPTGTDVTDAITTFDWNAVKALQLVERQWTDAVFIRCGKLGIEYPTEFATYDADVEAVLSQLDPLAITWPTRPSLPSGVSVD